MKEKIIHSLTNSNDATQTELRTLLFFTVVISLLLSLSQLIDDSVINSDGIFYLYLASLIQQGGWQAATEAYNWLFYPYIISLVSTLTSLTLESSAHVLNALFTATTCAAFILLIKEFGGKQKVHLYCASLIILCYPNLNEYRNLIIRDHGYWAFYLLSCYFFIKAYKKPTLKTVISLALFTSIAALFRIEGVIFIITLPLLLLLRHISLVQKPNSLTILILAATLLSVFAYSSTYQPLNVSGFTKFNQLQQALTSAITSISSALSSTQTFINTLSPQGFSNDYAPALLIFFFILVLLTEIVSATSPLYALALTSIFFLKRTVLNRQLIWPWIYLIAINIIILCGFLTSTYFLAGRYPIPLALILIIPLPFLVQLAYQQLQKKAFSTTQTYIAKITLVFFIVLTFDGLISTGVSKDYLKDAGRWIAANKDKNALLFTNNQFVSFYAGAHNGKRINEPSFNTVIREINNGKLNQFDILAVQISRKNTDGASSLLTSLAIEPVKAFKNRKGDSVFIFKP
ncbi:MULTISPECIES: glycosyltransferase family 39 protein [Cycloclasticus]|jgi:hypothetical protein|uniref:Uncharacterized protein n=1 Tax=Cycloclasticus zancles 78-ME TaxID=1198232 RepID=S5TV98_9GAMM|nr:MULTISPECIES: glycosyltransferase family 39 protein [Cycloclasticus]AGS39025.1 hypothetical protein CYCME_0684 [Cycloclasticus zancles 78-ME]MBV1899061.1 glycosyltransferase family 39 protein [Cycloclasticus sp.]PHR51014.1 MAG: hypothetical protein COA48_06085 [Cycloclasticus sp.]